MPMTTISGSVRLTGSSIGTLNIIDAKLTFNGTLKTRAKTTYIIIHHAAGSGMTPQEINDMHKKRTTNGVPWMGAAYNYYVRKDGSVYILRPDNKEGSHAPGYNHLSVGICFEGNYEEERTMPSAQKESGKKLVAYVLQKYPTINKILKHSAVTKTACPGKLFPFTEIVDGGKDILRRNGVGRVILSSSASVDSSDRSGSVSAEYTSGSYGIYVVKLGDTLQTIANMLGVDIQTLRSVNFLKTDTLRPGQELKYPINDKSRYQQIADDQKIINDGTRYSAYLSAQSTLREENYYITSKQFTENMNKIKHGERGSYGADGTYVRSDWENQEIALPGYDNAQITITTAANKEVVLNFLVSPSDASDSRSNAIQANKTNAGWFIYKLGPNLGQLSISGYLLDTKNEMERHAFLENYKFYVVDKRTSANEVYNENTVSIVLEGIQYIGYITSLTTGKSAYKQFLYSYNIQFLVVEDRFVYGSGGGESISETPVSSSSGGDIKVGDNLNNTLKGETYSYYDVKKGDTLYGIAEKLKTTIGDIMKLNPIIKNQNSILPGWKLKYPIK